MKYIQRLGKSLMLPVSIMPIAALLKGIGYWIDPTGWGVHSPLAALLITSGGTIIDNLPILFALAVAMEMSKKRDTFIALSTLTCYMTMTTILSPKCISLMMQIPEYDVDLAFHNIQSAFIGILIGLIVFISFRGLYKSLFCLYVSVRDQTVPFILCNLFCATERRREYNSRLSFSVYFPEAKS